MQTALLLSLVAAAAANPLKFPGSVAELTSAAEVFLCTAMP